MDLQKFLLKDTSGQKCYALTAFVIGAIVVNAKLVLSGVTIDGFTLSPFSGIDYGAAMAALGGIYVLKRNGDANNPVPNTIVRKPEDSYEVDHK